MLNSKPLNMGSFEPNDSILNKVSDWIVDNNPIPYSVRYWYNDMDILHPTRVWRKVSNIVRWVPVLWNDADWDYGHLYEIIDFKLTNMIEHHTDHHNHTDWEETVGQMTTARDALKRLRDDDYAAKEYAEHIEKFPHQDHVDVPGKPGWKQSAPLRPGESASFTKLADEEEKRRQADLDLFASTFVKHSRGWWD